jgi:tRNA-(ms[2]io[6]A)-hydroxylase
MSLVAATLTAADSLFSEEDQSEAVALASPSFASVPLACPTSAAWLEQALAHMDLILLDHANCEKKAAGNALSLLFRYSSRNELVLSVSPLAREELLHFEKVQRHLDRLGIPVRTLSAPPYASLLAKQIRTSEPHRLLDTLLIAAIIESRSHERLGLLGTHCPDPELAAFYRWLTPAEDRHQALYLDLALTYFSSEEVGSRLPTLLTAEAEILSTLHPEPRIHS